MIVFDVWLGSKIFVSGCYISGYQYRYFVPEMINQEWIWTSPKINRLLERASIKLGELNSFARMVPEIDLFIRLHVAKEAVISSKIEGPQTRFVEALLPIESIDPKHRNNWQEVNNYIQALNFLFWSWITCHFHLAC